MSLEFRAEELTSGLISEMSVMQDAYWRETTGDYHFFLPDPDWKTYLMAQRIGNLIIITARDRGNVLRGAAVTVIMPDMHYACISASIPMVFLDPAYRKGFDGVKLIHMAEHEACSRGAQLISTHGGIHTGVYRLFQALDYKNFGMYFTKILPDGPNRMKQIYKGGQWQ